MAQNISRASSSANPRCSSSNIPPKQSPKKHQQHQQRPCRGSMQASHSPSFTPARPVSIPKEGRNGVKATPTPEPKLDVGMTPQERYYKNLRVLRRRDPHIGSIFDQFAHVTVYYMLDDLNMERAGYEGTLFFFERDIEPRYGLFILNRQGMHDYIRYLLHDDVFEVTGDAVWISTLSPISRNAMGDQDKTTGFWTLATDSRETLGDMMMRLAPYIRRGERYPDEFRYGPDRAVPHQNNVPSGNRDDAKHDFLRDLPDEMREKILKTVQIAKAKAQEEGDGRNSKENSNSIPLAQSTPSELDQLFSKLAASEVPPPDPTPPVPQTGQQPLTGIALLDTMFASVSSPPIPSISGGQRLTLQQLGLAPSVSSPPESMEIISPKPSTAGLPQILTTDVIDELMGLPSSDSRSASRSSTSASCVERPRSPSSAGGCRGREQGYFADFGEDDGGTSEASTNIEPDVQTSESILERLLPGTRTTFLSAATTAASGSLKGDATPRARVEQLAHTSPPVNPPPNVALTVSANASPSINNKKSGAQLKATSRTFSEPSTVRINFQSGAELWPNGESSDTGTANGTGDGNEVVELDFSEIGALDDIRSFEAKANNNIAGGRERDAKGREKVKINGSTTIPKGVHKGIGIVTTLGKGTNANREREKSGPKTIVPTPQAIQSTDIRQDVVGQSLRTALLRSNLLASDGQALSKNAFVREVLTLIHTDSKFVDKMYQTYQDSVSSST